MKRRFEDDMVAAPPSIDGPLFKLENPFADSQIAHTDNEELIAELICHRKGRARPISIHDIKALTGLSDRSVKEVVEQLRITHRMPIGASRHNDNPGYFWIVDAEDRAAAVEPYKRQIITMWRTLRVLDSTEGARELLGQLRLED
jgi:hypothetical protein